MNPIQSVRILKNRYFGMRHGQSMANCEGIIVSRPENGIPQYGLSNAGREQIRSSLSGNRVLNAKTHIICSDFKRTVETAELVSQLLNCVNPVIPDPRLRERDFGDFELTPDSNYQIVWGNDAIDGSHTHNHVESADSVMQRTSELVLSLEQKFSGETILLVAHGDSIQILQAAFYKQPASMQRALKHLETAEIRELELKISANLTSNN